MSQAQRLDFAARSNQTFELPPTMVPANPVPIPVTEQWLKIEVTQDLPLLVPPTELVHSEKVADEVAVEVTKDLPVQTAIFESIYLENELNLQENWQVEDEIVNIQVAEPAAESVCEIQPMLE